MSAPIALTNGAISAKALDEGSKSENSELAVLSSLTLNEHAQIIGTGRTAQERNAAIPIAAGAVQPMAAFRVADTSSGGFDAALQCLTQAIYYEAANEPLAGKRAVAQVVLNRVRHQAYPSSVCGVVYEGWSQPVCQFSFVCDGSLRRAPSGARWSQSRNVAREALAGHVEASVGTATHYHADYVLPRWAYELDKVKRIGRHLFYRFPGTGGRATSFTARWSGIERIPQIDLAHLPADNFDLSSLDDDVAVEPWKAPDPTDRRAANDVGGRMDPGKGWQLAIPDPADASSAYHASLREQDRTSRIARADIDAANGGITP
ncbi:cell wall hydrolase [Alteraurantiacibacter aestuarii]|uniref:cell wall hydrolase n=1 Tax=Alteraurantiacibacter aestuarii TaxID=650004 RepID=UPI0031DAE4E4